MSLARMLLIVTLMGGLAAPAGAAEMAPETERVLWCASAFNWLARDADDAADAVGAEILDAWSIVFTERATRALRLAGLDQPAIEAAIASSDQTVLTEMKHKQMRYDVEACPELEDEEDAVGS